MPSISHMPGTKIFSEPISQASTFEDVIRRELKVFEGVPIRSDTIHQIRAKLRMVISNWRQMGNIQGELDFCVLQDKENPSNVILTRIDDGECPNKEYRDDARFIVMAPCASCKYNVIDAEIGTEDESN